MSTTDGTKSAGKSGRRKGKGEKRKKAVSQEAVSQQGLPESAAPAQLQSPDPDQELQQPEPVHAESQPPRGRGCFPGRAGGGICSGPLGTLSLPAPRRPSRSRLWRPRLPSPR